MQHEAIPSSPISSYAGTEADSHRTTISLWVVVESNKVTPEPPLDWAIPVSLAVPLKTCTPDPSPASLPFSEQAPGPQCPSWTPGLGSCSAKHQPIPPGLFPLHSLPATLPQACRHCLGSLWPKCRTWHLDLLNPAIQPIQIPAQGLPTPKHIDTSSQLSVICKLTEGALNTLIQVISKDTEQLQAPVSTPCSFSSMLSVMIKLSRISVPLSFILYRKELSAV